VATPERLLGYGVGFDHYLVKPCDPGEIIAITSAYGAARRV
jgi:DNA-binding response OmpR family regulator